MLTKKLLVNYVWKSYFRCAISILHNFFLLEDDDYFSGLLKQLAVLITYRWWRCWFPRAPLPHNKFLQFLKIVLKTSWFIHAHLPSAIPLSSVVHLKPLLICPGDSLSIIQCDLTEDHTPLSNVIHLYSSSIVQCGSTEALTPLSSWVFLFS